MKQDEVTFTIIIRDGTSVSAEVVELGGLNEDASKLALSKCSCLAHEMIDRIERIVARHAKVPR